ncbi:MAG: hypothetical protein QM662_08725 [Gordonia sp. (in: high G+C Gram-positive bacteria)]
MSKSTVRRGRWAAAALAGAAALTLAACGTEESAAPAPTSSSITSGPSGSVPVVPGPRPGAASATTSVADTLERSGEVCDRVPGPDGSLRVIVQEGRVSCRDALAVAEEYAPRIATGNPHTVNGWKCGPASSPGVLASCTKGESRIAFAP